MTEQTESRHPPLVLLVQHQEWTARSVESVLRPAGYAVVKAYTGRDATEVAAKLRPDLVIVGYRLSDSLGLDTCRALKELPTVNKATPFVIATAKNLSKRERHECFAAGIWDIFSSPFDPVELVGKLDTFLSARREVEDAWEATHRDPVSGLYNWNGLLARAVESIADAQRSGRWTSCVAIGPRYRQSPASPGGSAEDASQRRGSDEDWPDVVRRIAATLAEATRESDPTGVLGTSDFLVLAPGTDGKGASTLANRLIETLNERAIPEERRRSGLEFGAGYYAALTERDGTLVAQDLLGRAMEALRAAQKADTDSPAILPFDLT